MTTYWKWQKNPEWPLFLSSNNWLPREDRNSQWVANALETGGVLSIPSSEEALYLLLLVTGVDVPSFGVVRRSRSVNDLYRELVTKQCSLLMKDGKPVRLVENLYICLIWKEYVLVQTLSEVTKPKSRGEAGVDTVKHTSYTLITGRKKYNEAVTSAALRCLQTDVFPEVHDIEVAIQVYMTNKFRSAENYQLFERVETDKSYPGINLSQCVHFFKLKLRNDATEVIGKRLPQKKRTLGPNDYDFSTLTRTPLKPSGEMREKKYWTWLNVTQTRKKTVSGFDYINIDNEATYRDVNLSSLMIGVEGSAPKMFSPFGVSHDASGKSKDIACAGGRKWRAYRKNQGKQIPADLGGMRIFIDQYRFRAFRRFLSEFDMLDPADDVLLSSGRYYRGLRMHYTNKRFFEKEFFQKLLSSGTYHAHKLVDDYLEQKERCVAGRFNIKYIPNGPPIYKSGKSPSSPKKAKAASSPTSARAPDSPKSKSARDGLLGILSRKRTKESSSAPVFGSHASSSGSGSSRVPSSSPSNPSSKLLAKTVPLQKLAFSPTKRTAVKVDPDTGIVSITNVAELKHFLGHQTKIETSQWHHSALKTLSTSIEQGLKWIVMKGNLVVLRMEPVYIQLVYKDRVLVVEDVQGKESGPDTTKCFLSTNKKINEQPYEAAISRLKEALNVVCSKESVVPLPGAYKTMESTKQADKYPSLPVICKTHFVFLNIVDPTPFKHCGLPSFGGFRKKEVSKDQPLEVAYKWYKRKDAYTERIKQIHPDDKYTKKIT